MTLPSDIFFKFPLDTFKIFNSFLCGFKLDLDLLLCLLNI